MTFKELSKRRKDDMLGVSFVQTVRNGWDFYNEMNGGAEDHSLVATSKTSTKIDSKSLVKNEKIRDRPQK